MPKNNYAVGYGKPPKEFQFKKGQSGNPRGRPRKPKLDRGLAAIFERIDKEEVEVRGQKMTYRELEIRSLVAKAAKGDVVASRHLHKLRADVGADKSDDRKGGVLLAPMPLTDEEFEKAAREQQARWREIRGDAED